MQSTGRPNFWIPPESTYETAVPSPTSASGLSPEPATPTRVNTRFNRPPLPLPSPQKQSQRPPNIAPPIRSPSPQPVRHNDRTGKEYNRRERRFEDIFNSWSQEVARLQEEHRAVSLKCRNEEETTLAMDNFNLKVQAVMTKYNEEIEALQMSSSEPPSSQSENEEEEDSPAPTPARNHTFHLHQNNAGNENDDDEEDEEDDDEDSGEDDEDDEDDLVNSRVNPPEHALDDDDDDEEDENDEERASTPLSEAMVVDMSSGDDTDHSARLSRRSYQSSEVSQGSLNNNTPPPTEIDEDHRAARRRQTRERRKTDELASALPQRLRSETLRGGAIAAAPRPAAMSLFENLSSSPASMSSMASPHASSPYGSRRPSRDVPTVRPSPIEVNPTAIASRIDYLRRQNSTSGSDRSLSRNRQASPADERSLFRDQFESWKTSIQNQSEAVLKKVEKQTEDVKHKFKVEQEEKHQRAQQIFIAEQERLLQSFNRNRAGSTGSTSASAGPAVGSHPRSGSFALPQGQSIGPSVSPTLQRAVPSPAPQSSSPAGRPLHSTVSQTFQYASVVSQSPPQSSPSRTWIPRNTPMSNQPENRRSTASSSESDDPDGAVEDEESDALPTYKGTPPISIPNSARGSFDMGHRRTGSQVYSGTSGASSTPRNPFPQNLRNSSSTTFSSNGTASARSSGGWSGVSGASTNTTVTSSDTPGSRRGSVGEKTFVAPTNLHGESRKIPNGPVGTSPPSGPRWTAMVGSTEVPGSVTHSPVSTLSRASGAAMNPNSGVNIPPRSTAQQWRNEASASSPSAASAVPPNANPSTSAVGSIPRPSIGSLNLTQSPGKSSWKATATGKPSPPIPIQTKPSGPNPQRQWTDTPPAPGSISNASPPLPFRSMSRDSPTLRSTMSNVDLVSASGPRAVLKSRQSTSAFNAASTREDLVGRGSRSKSPSRPVTIPAKSSPSKMSSIQPSADLSDVTQSSPEPEVTLPKREHKKSETSKRAKNKEEADRRKREEDLLRREEDLKRREEEIKREQREEKKRREKEAERKREEDLLRREAELREREERLKRQEAEIAEARRKREAEEAEAEAKRQKEAEVRRQREADAAAKRQREEEEEERQARNSLDEQNRRASQPPKEPRKRGKKGAAKRSADEQKELEAARERERIAEEERLAEEARLEERLEDERLEAEARKEEELRKEAKRREQEARKQEARISAERREEARLAAERAERREEARLAAERQKQERLDARLAAEILEQERQEDERRKRELERLEARRAAEKRELERQEEERLEQAREQRKAELYRQEQEALKKLAEDRERKRNSLRHEDDRRQTWTRQQEEEEKRQEEERRAQEARIREENNRMTEMFQARDRSNQVNSNMPKRFTDAWEAYDEKWKRLVTQAQTGDRPALTFATVPWPLLNPPSGPEAITRNAVGAFVLSQWHSKGKSPRDRIRDALLRWHPDRFESRYLGWVPEGDERENVRIGVGNVTRSLNELLTKEGPGAPL